MATHMDTNRVSLSNREFANQIRWPSVGFSRVHRRKRSKFLTPFGWFTLTAVVTAVAGAALAFVT
jgi:hypothetical protein